MSSRLLRWLLPVVALGLLAIPAEAGAARTLSISDASLTEPLGSGTAPMTFTATLSAAHKKKTVKASFGTSPGAANSLDYVPTFGAVKFKPGKTTKTIKIPVRSDLFAEPDEDFEVELSEPRRTAIADGSGEGTILANDNGPDGDSDGIPDADDCDPVDPNPEGALECYVPTTIYDINQGNIAPGTRAYLDNVLITATNGRLAYGAIVPGDPGYTVQDFSGIELDAPAFSLGEQGRYQLLGTTGTARFNVADSEEQNCCESQPGPVSLTPAQFAAGPDEYNGLLVEVATVSIASSTATQWLMNEGLAVDDDLFTDDDLPGYGAGTTFESVTGHATTAGAGTPALSPRSLGDIDPTVAMLLERNYFDDCLLPDEQDVTIFEVVIDEPQATDTVIDLEVDDPALLDVPDTVTVTMGNTTAPVIVDSLGPEGEATITTTLGPFEDEFDVFVDQFC